MQTLFLLVLNNNEEMTNEELTMLDKYNNEKITCICK